MNQAAHSHARIAAMPVQAGAVLRRQCDCGTHTPGGASCGKCASGKSGGKSVPPIVNQVLASPGQPLDADTRGFMENGFGQDLSGVRVHTDSRAAQSAQAVNAQAYAVGNNIVFKNGLYSPHSRDGRRLLAHELAHVVQQQSGAKSDGPASEIGDADSAAEHQADAAAHAIMSGGRAPHLPALGALVQRTVGNLDPAASDPNPSKEPTAPIARPAPVKADQPAVPAVKSQCGGFELFTKLDMPTFVPNSFFRGSTPLDEKEWESQRKAASKDKCVAKGEFPNVKLSWDMGNPKLGTYWTKDLNVNDMTFDIIVYAVQDSKLCCQCLGGNVTWSLGMGIKHGSETGHTKAPLAGSKASDACKGDECCTVAQTLPINLSFGNDSISSTIEGTVKLEAKTYGDNPKPGAPPKPADKTDTGLSTGAKVGIGFGVAAGLGGLITGGYFLGKALKH